MPDEPTPRKLGPLWPWVLGTVAVTVAIAVCVKLPDWFTLSSRAGPGPELLAVRSLRAYAAAQTTYRRGDWHADGRLGYAHPFSLLHSQKGPEGGPLMLIDAAFAAATSPKSPKSGYYFTEMQTIGGEPIDWTADFALCASPAVYGKTGYRTYIVGTDGTVFGKDLGDRAAPPTDCPADPMAEDWLLAE